AAASSALVAERSICNRPAAQSPCRRASRDCVVAPTAIANPSAAMLTTAQRRCAIARLDTTAAANAVAVAPITRYSTVVALSHRLVDSKAMDDAMIQPDPRQPDVAPTLSSDAI